jgi:hypothetical protein
MAFYPRKSIPAAVLGAGQELHTIPADTKNPLIRIQCLPAEIKLEPCAFAIVRTDFTPIQTIIDHG